MTHTFRIGSLRHTDPDAARGHGRRTAHLALSTRGAAPAEELTLDLVNAFVDRLVGLPPLTWLGIGQRLIADRQGLAVRQCAWSNVEAALSDYALEVSAWRVRDMLETAAFLVSRRVSDWTREGRCQFAATHGAADSAALALLARAHLPADTLRILGAPFAAFVELEFV